MKLDGDPTDACSIACYVALRSCRFPKVDLYAGESGAMEDFEIAGDLSESISIDALKIPILLTILKVLSPC